MQFSILPAPDVYTTIAASATAEFKEKASRFIGFAYPVSDEKAVQQCLDALKKEHFKATHVCYAYRLGLLGTQFRANDDGEPNATAGKPILGQIDSFGLTNVLVAVVRYYGGTKLGTGGLKNAYKYGAKIALDAAPKLEVVVEELFEIIYPYSQTNALMHLLKMQNINIQAHLTSQDEAENHSPALRVAVRKSLQADFVAALDKLINVSYEKLPAS
jgi:uncharacterized YigZ family protein